MDTSWNTRPAAWALAAAVILTATAPGNAAAGAQRHAEVIPEPAERYADVGIRRVRTEVMVTIESDSRTAHYEIHEEFLNTSHRVLEGTYLYPIPRDAVFRNLSLFMGETELRGEMLDADQARAIYQEIVRKRLDPALVERVGEGLLRARVFPIEPGQSRKIILRYTQLLPREGDLVRLHVPHAAGLIASDGTTPDRPTVAQPTRPAEGPAHSIRVRIDTASRFLTPTSLTHAIEVDRLLGDVVEVTTRGNATARSTAAFELLLPLASADLGATVLAHSPAPGSESGYFMLMFTPPAAEIVLIPRDLTLAIDVSGSMSGHKIEQARAAVAQVLRGLRVEDRFRVITFASVVRSFEGDWTSASAENVERAVSFLRGVPADGSTNIHDALKTALAPAADPGRLSQVVFLTDGLPTVAETDPVRIADLAATLSDGERVFAFGVGDDVNTYLLDRLAESGRGTTSYVAPAENVEAAVSSLTRKFSSPVLMDLRIAEAPVPLEEIYPTTLPDLFHGEELVVFGRYRGGAGGALVLEGVRNGETRRYPFTLDFPRNEPTGDHIARLWASRKAGVLSTRLRVHGHDPETLRELRQLGLRHGVLTELTAYLVQEPGMRAEAEALGTAPLAQPPAAPRAQAGEWAVKRARSDARLRQAASSEAFEEVLDATIQAGDQATGRDRTRQWQRAGRRIFMLRDGRWSDIGLDTATRHVRVRPGSAAYFEILESYRALRSAVALGDHVMIAGESLTLHITPEGSDSLTDEDRRELERAFAGERR